MYELKIPALTEKLDEVLAFVGEKLDEFHCPMDVRMQIDLAIEEIYVNIANYAYHPIIGEAIIRLQVDEGPPIQVRIELVDEGQAFDPLQREDPNLELDAEDRDIGGLGIFMVKSYMDAVDYRYEDGANILTLHKTFEPEAGPK